MRASIKSKLTIVMQQGLVILICGVLALGVYRFMNSIIVITPAFDGWHSCEPAYFEAGQWASETHSTGFGR